MGRKRNPPPEPNPDLKSKECPACGQVIGRPSDHHWTCDFHPDSLAQQRRDER